MLKRLLIGLAVVVALSGTAVAENLALSGNDRWVAVASRQNLNEAISIAEAYSAQKSRVVTAQNGWFAVILGPYATSDIVNFQRDYGGPALPSDAILTRGTGYVTTVWLPSGAQAAAPEGSFQQALDRRIGQTVANYAIDHGPPEASFAVAAGQMAFQWTFTRNFPGLVAPIGNMTIVTGPQTRQCMVTLIASSTANNPVGLGDWTVSATRFSGACFGSSS